MVNRKNYRTGDTIIEVMLAMSIIGIVLGGAFGIANRSVSVGQDAQERTEALKIAETQLEIFKSQFPNSAALRGRTEAQAFCFNVAANPPAVRDDSDDACSLVSATGFDGLYSIRIVPPGVLDQTRSYTIEVTWERLGATSTDNSENSLILYYKPGEV